jgi:hypothetical protein
MAYQNKLYPVVLGIALTIACACGGGGGGGTAEKDAAMSTEEIKKRSYKLYPENYLAAGYTEEYDLSGTLKNGVEINAKLNVSMVGESNQQEKPNFFTEQSLDIFFSDGSTKHRRIINKRTLKKVINTRIYPEGEKSDIENDAKDTLLPDTAEIGSYGTLFEAIDKDGNTETTSWLLEVYGGLGVQLILQTEVKNNEEQTVYFENISFSINQKGERKDVSIYVEYPLNNLEIFLD